MRWILFWVAILAGQWSLALRGIDVEVLVGAEPEARLASVAMSPARRP